MTTKKIEINNGNVTALFTHGDFRKIKVDGSEIIQRIYFAVRDAAWLNVACTVNNFEERINTSEKIYSYNLSFDNNAIKFSTDIKCFFKNDSIQIEARGKALCDFQKNRIGFCVHLPAFLQSVNCEIEHVDSTKTISTFPRYVLPHQPFRDVSSVLYAANNHQIKIHFEGDVFEMEDQRNWTDASFKIYSTPLGNPFPVSVKAGESFYQKITIQFSELNTQEKQSSEKNEKDLFKTITAPAIGLAAYANEDKNRSFNANKKQSLPFAHYRVDFYLNDISWQTSALQSIERAKELNLPLYATVFLGKEFLSQTNTFIQFLQSQKDIVVKFISLLSYENFVLENTVVKELLFIVRTAFPDAKIGVGTDANFAQLNRSRPDVQGFDFISYAIQPQEHATDILSIAENISGQRDTVYTAALFSNDKPVHISALSFFRRFNANIDFTAFNKKVINAHEGDGFESAWFIGSLHQLIASGVSVINCCCALDDNSVFTHNLLLLGKYNPESFYLYGSESPEEYALLAWNSNSKRYVIVANLTNDVLEVKHPFVETTLQPFENKLTESVIRNNFYNT